MKALRDPQYLLADGLAAIRAQFQVPESFPPQVLAAAEQAAAEEAASEHGAAAEQAAAEQAAADQAAADQAAIDAAVLAAASSGPKGPPMTGSEIEGVAVAIKTCFNIGTLSTVASQVRITVRLDVGQDGRPVGPSIRMTGFEGGDEAAAGQVFEVAKRAIIRCSKEGLPLPADKYDTWKDLELGFDPSGVRF